jgi:hypothetical protein
MSRIRCSILNLFCFRLQPISDTLYSFGRSRYFGYANSRQVNTDNRPFFIFRVDLWKLATVGPLISPSIGRENE